MTKFFFTLALFTSPILASAQENDPEKINWPANYEPENSSFYVYNEIEINAPADTVWRYLIDAENWPNWYPGAKNVALLHASDSMLQAKSVFRWETMGLQFESTIHQFEPARLLAWESKKSSIQGYHVWLLIPTSTGCKVITAESQNGWLSFFEKIFQPKKLKRLHDVWLKELKKKSEA